MKRILVIDDDPSVISVLKRGLAYQGYAVDTAESGEKGLSAASDRLPDLVILDIMMPGMDGLEVLRRLRTADPQLPVILLTAKDTSTDQIAGLERGADDYVVKPFTFGVLVARIQSLLRRHEAERPDVLRFSDLSLDIAMRSARRGSREISLTKTEFELLHEIMKSPRQVLTRATLMENVWGYDFDGDTNVLDVYIRQLRQKLEAGGEPRLIQTMRGVGYALREEE